MPGFLVQALASRGVSDVAELDLSLRGLLPPFELDGVFAAAHRLSDAIKNDERILIVGDFDADGATASAVSVSLLRAMGAKQVDFLVPNRFEFGYGLTREIVTVALERDPAVLVTVDNGISSLAGVEAAQTAGVDVIVTDHHLPGADLPNAHAIVNPNLTGCGFASKSLAGVGVVYYVLSVLRASLREEGYFAASGIEEPNMAN
ncbi:MAG: DHH family phosphoesterase, partial [Gammaproteobacteria bacterium]|nr:DHH family phosphoesterase [Gammaproteobacteria bacterium]